MTDNVEALVAEVLDSFRVALNEGSSRGVAVGDDVTIWRLVNVTDPESGEHLGTVRLDKLKLSVTVVDERYSVAAVRAETPGTDSAALGPRKRIATGLASSGDEVVSVEPGDEVTVHLADRPE